MKIYLIIGNNFNIIIHLFLLHYSIISNLYHMILNMKKITLIISTFIVLLLNVSLQSQNNEVDEITITKANIQYAPETGFVHPLPINNSISYEYIDMNMNGEKDFVIYTEGVQNYISIRTLENESIGEKPIKEKICGNFSCEDVSGDSVPEVIYITLDNYNVNLHIFNYKKGTTITKLLYTGNDNFKDGNFDASFYDAKVLNHSNGKQLLLLEMGTGHDGQPRGIIALNLPDLSLAWDFLIGSRPVGSMVIDDLDDDGKNEIIFSTFAPGNGITLNGYSDDKSYFIVLDENGKEKYHLNYSGPISYCYFNIIKPHNEIVIYGYKMDVGIVDPCALLIGGAYFELKKSHSTSERFIFAGYPVNTVRENIEDYFYYFDDYNVQHVLNKNLNKRKSIILPYEINKVFDFYISDKNETIYLTALWKEDHSSTTFLLFNKEFDLLGKKNIPVESFLNFQFDKSETEGKLYFIDIGRQKIFEWVIPLDQLQLTFNLNYFLIANRTPIILIVILLSLIFAGTSIVNIISRKNLHIQKLKSLSKYFIENPVESIVVFNESGYVESINIAFLKLFEIKDTDRIKLLTYHELLESIKTISLIEKVEMAYSKNNQYNYFNLETDLPIHETLHKLKIEIQKVILDKKRFSIVLKFYDLTAFTRADRISNWAAIAQKLAHEIKNPLMSMSLSLGRLEKKLYDKDKSKEESKNKYFTFIREDIERMRDSTNQFLKFTSSLDFNFSPCLINNLLEKIVHNYKSVIDDRVSFELSLNYDVQYIKIDEEQTKQVLINIIDNAIDAIPNEGIIKIETKFINKFPLKNGLEKKYVQIIISDNGMGITNENLSKIFEPNFTTKKTGSGFGLAIAKHVIEEQQGSISISSKVEVGTIITIELPDSKIPGDKHDR